MAELLLIDDDRSLSELLSDFLVGAGHTVHHAADGDAGLRMFFAVHPDLVILDVTMPQRDGWQTIGAHPRACRHPRDHADGAQRGG